MLNKKELRPFAVPSLALDPNNGLLYAQAVDYIVCTDVQTIGSQPILMLHILPRQNAAEGDYRPVCTMFQGKNGYITLEQKDGKSKWRTASFERLLPDNYLGQSCAFYSVQDERRVNSYFKDEDAKDFSALIKAQDAYIAARRKARQLAKERKTLARMEGIPALPDGLESWARRDVVPAYFIYNHAKKGAAKGTCSACGQVAELSNVKYKNKAACPHCGREMTMIPMGHIRHLRDRETGVVIQRMGAELIIRILKIQAKYPSEVPIVTVRENARQFVSLGPEGAVERENYYLSCGEVTNWKEGTRPVYYNRPTFESITYGYLYCDNLPGDLAGTPWRYCPIVQFYDYDRAPMAVFPFLAAHIEHPKYEHLVKVGFYDLVCQLVYHPHYHYPAPKLDEGQNRTHRILGVGAEDVAFLRDMKAGLEELQLFQTYYRATVKDRQKLFSWQKEHKISADLSPILTHTTVHKLVRYIDGQYAVLKDRKGAWRYESMSAVTREYIDYLDMCAKQHYNMKNSFVLYPKDLQISHDRVVQRIKIKADMKMREDFSVAYKRIMGQLDFEKDGMKIVYPASPDEIIAEGQALHHCVGGYVDRVAAHKTMILFLRRSEDATKPYYTIEITNRKVAQVRGHDNIAPPPDVEKFMQMWERKVLRSHDAEMEAA